MQTQTLLDERIQIRASKKYLDRKAEQLGYYWNNHLNKYENIYKRSFAWYNEKNEFVIHYRS